MEYSGMANMPTIAHHTVIEAPHKLITYKYLSQCTEHHSTDSSSSKCLRYCCLKHKKKSPRVGIKITPGRAEIVQTSVFTVAAVVGHFTWAAGVDLGTWRGQ